MNLGASARIVLLLTLVVLIGATLSAPAVLSEDGGKRASAGAPRLDSAGANGEHWAFRPARRPPIPTVQTGRARTAIDSFLLAELEKKGLAYAAEADRFTLLRRAYLDVWGLPPPPAAVDAFLADDRPDAFERVLDTLLASPRFGERWGRHWLDVAGYTDTVGFDVDAGLILQSEGKWRYRDYVIDAFNRDMPFDRFVRDQLAGDEAVDWRRAKTFTKEILESLIATGFLRNARDESHEPESNIPSIYYGVLHNTVDLVGSSLLGLTLECARCHDHKFDPIAQKEYYQLMAFLTPAYNPRDWRPVYPWKPGLKDRSLPDVAPEEQAEIERHNRDLDQQTEKLNAKLADLRRPYETRLRAAKAQTLPEAIRADTLAALDATVGNRTPVQKYLVEKLGKTLEVSVKEITAALSDSDRTAVAVIDEQLAGLRKHRKTFGRFQPLFDVGPPPPTYFLKRGNHETPGKEVEPGFPLALIDPGKPVPIPAAVEHSSGRRTALAQWLTRPDSRASALLARVLVNRLWQHLFGQGLVATPENFGRSGEAPTHPELLEWLSDEFARSGWRIKPMLKLMMTSSAYRQESRQADASARSADGPGRADPAKVDPGNKLLWKMRLRRLEAETIRDSMLAVSGRLNLAMGGPPVKVRSLAGGMVVVDDKAQADPQARDRRSIYLVFRRAYNLSLLAVFDQPLVAVNCSRRDVAAVPLQSLTMMNDAFVAEQAKHFADRVAQSAGNSGEKAITAAFRLALARQPTAAELAVCAELLDRQTAAFRQVKLSPGEAERKAVVQLCHTLYGTSEFLYAE